MIDLSINQSQAKKQSPNNPYIGIDPKKSLTRLQELLDSIGITNYGRRAQYEQDIASNQWESQYALSLEDRDYNDYISQVQRMRAAGLNPDFQSVSGGDSSLASNQAGALAPPSLGDSHPLGNIFENIMSGLTTAMSVYSGVLDIQRKSEDNLNELIKPFIEDANNMSLEDFMRDYRSNDSRIVPSLKYNFSGMSRLQQKKANQRMAQYLGSAAHESAILERNNSVLSKREDNLAKSSSMSATDPVGFKEIMNIISKNTYELTKSSQYKDILKNQYESKGLNYGLNNESFRHQYDIEGMNSFAAEKRNESLSKSIQEQELDLETKRWQQQVRSTQIKMCEDMLRSRNPFVQMQGLSLFNTLYSVPTGMKSAGNLLNSIAPLDIAKQFVK